MESVLLVKCKDVLQGSVYSIIEFHTIDNEAECDDRYPELELIVAEDH